jgi:hypothetical protein
MKYGNGRNTQLSCIHASYVCLMYCLAYMLQLSVSFALQVYIKTFHCCSGYAWQWRRNKTWWSAHCRSTRRTARTCDFLTCTRVTRSTRVASGSSSERHVSFHQPFTYFSHVTSRHVTSRHVTSRHVTSRHVTSRHVTSRHVTSR